MATSFEYRLYPVTEVLGGVLEYPAGRISELLRIYQNFAATVPDEIMLVSTIVPSKQGPRLTIRFRYCGEPSVGNQLQILARADQTAKQHSKGAFLSGGTNDRISAASETPALF